LQITFYFWSTQHEDNAMMRSFISNNQYIPSNGDAPGFSPVSQVTFTSREFLPSCSALLAFAVPNRALLSSTLHCVPGLVIAWLFYFPGCNWVIVIVL
jgi:hypothetical protein